MGNNNELTEGINMGQRKAAESEERIEGSVLSKVPRIFRNLGGVFNRLKKVAQLETSDSDQDLDPGNQITGKALETLYTGDEEKIVSDVTTNKVEKLSGVSFCSLGALTGLPRKVLQDLIKQRHKEVLVAKEKEMNYQPHSSTSPSIYWIPSVLGDDLYADALGDYCAKENFMKEDYAIRSGMKIHRYDTKKVRIGSGRTTTTVGTVMTSFRFRDEKESFWLTFHLIPDCVQNVILGRPFLRATKTFSVFDNYSRRVKKRLKHGVVQHRLLYLGDSTPRFSGLINGQSQEALADSGAKLLIMDEDYAHSLNLAIAKNRTKLMYADSSTGYTSGIAYGVKWQYGFDKVEDSQEYSLDFHILKNASAKVILSDDFLFSTNAYSEYQSYLIDEGHEDEDDDAYFFAIDIDSRDLKQDEALLETKDGKKLLELVRKGEQEDRIATLPDDEQAAAWEVENERRRRWNSLLDVNESGVSIPSPSSNMPDREARQPTGDDGSAPHQASFTNRLRSWFKLKRKSGL